MPETTIWKGTSSQWKNYKVYVFFLVVLALCCWLYWAQHAGSWIFFLLIPPGLWAFWSWLQVKSKVFTLTSERLVSNRGILTRVTDSLELYRVRDFQIVRPLLHRMVGLNNIHIISADATSPDLVLDYLPITEDMGELVRKSIEACRASKNVRTMDVVNETPDHPGDAGGSPLT
jgi:uncharacterized membrane protein YdbT with pleckstrin-like domain